MRDLTAHVEDIMYEEQAKGGSADEQRRAVADRVQALYADPPAETPQSETPIADGLTSERENATQPTDTPEPE